MRENETGERDLIVLLFVALQSQPQRARRPVGHSAAQGGGDVFRPVCVDQVDAWRRAA